MNLFYKITGFFLLSVVIFTIRNYTTAGTITLPNVLFDNSYYKLFGVNQDTLAPWESCREQYGNSAKLDIDGNCRCISGFEMTRQEDGSMICSDETYNSIGGDGYKYSCWDNSYFDRHEVACKCLPGFALGKDNLCSKTPTKLSYRINQIKFSTSELIMTTDWSGKPQIYQIGFQKNCIPQKGSENYAVFGTTGPLDRKGSYINVNLGSDGKLSTDDSLKIREYMYCTITYIKELKNYEWLNNCSDVIGSSGSGGTTTGGNWFCCPEGMYEKNGLCYNYSTVATVQTPINNIKNDKSENELLDAIKRMYSNGLTSFNTENDFNGEGELTREQAAKFFVQFSKNILSKQTDTSISVKLGDLNKADKNLQPYIVQSNQMGLFKGVDGQFYPFNKLTIAQALAVLIRAKNGYHDESGDLRYSGYYGIAYQLGILKGLGFDRYTAGNLNIKRKEIALMMYRMANQ